MISNSVLSVVTVVHPWSLSVLPVNIGLENRFGLDLMEISGTCYPLIEWCLRFADDPLDVVLYKTTTISIFLRFLPLLCLRGLYGLLMVDRHIEYGD